ncbi:MAG: hypothetical protein ACJAY2_002999 [Pseudomonadales bacterium]|jgi:hypothetical protein
MLRDGHAGHVACVAQLNESLVGTIVTITITAKEWNIVSLKKGKIASTFLAQSLHDGSAINKKAESTLNAIRSAMKELNTRRCFFIR